MIRMPNWFSVRRAIHRARWPILSMALTYAVSVGTGMALAHAGNEIALGYRDRLVARAYQHDPAAIAFRERRRFKAALWDFTRNLGLGAVPQTLTGLAVVLPYGFAAYRGWVGGIVSVDRLHRSRLLQPGRAASYLITLVLQLIPYSLAGGIGVHLGLTYFRRPDYYSGPLFSGYPVEAFRDVIRVYVLIVPLFFIASLWEFLNPWA